MNQFFDPATGMLLLDECVEQRPTFQKIMNDEQVTEDEVASQAALVISLLKEIDNKLSPDDKALVADTIAEMAVLQAISQIQQLQEISNLR